MKDNQKIAVYSRVCNYDQLPNAIDQICEMAKQGEIKTLVVGTLERLCDDPIQRQKLIKELTDCGVEIITAFDEEK